MRPRKRSLDTKSRFSRKSGLLSREHVSFDEPEDDNVYHEHRRSPYSGHSRSRSISCERYDNRDVLRMQDDDRFERISHQSTHDNYLDNDESRQHPCEGLLQTLDEICRAFAGRRKHHCYDTRDSDGNLSRLCIYIFLAYFGYNLCQYLFAR